MPGAGVFWVGDLGRHSMGYGIENLAERALYSQVSKRLNWKKDEIPEVYPFYSHMLIGWLIHLLQCCSVFPWQRAEAIGNRRKPNRIRLLKICPLMFS